ncbi:hypothetical protein [Paractinoplanes durhamensis]|nr:hypothetical protein [Actinoplanes durhamensis]
MTHSLDAAHRGRVIIDRLRPRQAMRPAPSEHPDDVSDTDAAVLDAAPIGAAVRVVALPAVPVITPWLFDVVTLDGGGRFVPRDAVDVLRWRTYTDVALRITADHRVTATKVTRRAKAAAQATVVSTDGRGRLCLPSAHRTWLGVEPGDRVLVGTNRRSQQLVLMPAATLAGVLA